MIQLPNEIMHIILEYYGKIKYRNGKYINQINTENNNYELVKEKLNNKIAVINNIKKEIKYNQLYHIHYDIPYNNEFRVWPIINISQNKTQYGLSYNYDTIRNQYDIYFYKDISNTLWYRTAIFFYNFFSPNYYLQWYFSEKYEYK